MKKEKSVIEKAETFEIKHKIISLLIVMISTILITRSLISISDPNMIIKGFELHHFYYGLILLIITSLLMLYRRGNFKLHLILTGISIGLIIDELMFIGTKIRGTTNYSSTFTSAIILAIIIVFIAEFIFYLIGKRK